MVSKTLLVSIYFLACFGWIRADNTINQINQIFSQNTNTAFQQGAAWLRNAHGKQHGCARGYVSIDHNLPPRFQQGIFNVANSNNSDGVYPCFIRFSNGAGRGFVPGSGIGNQSDSSLDVRGFALKLFGVKGDKLNQVNAETQDFTYITSSVTFVGDLPTSLSYFQAVQAGKLAFAGFLALHPRVAYLLTKTALDGGIQDYLQTTFWIPYPAQFGPSDFVKYRLSPCNGQQSAFSESTDFNFLTEALKAALNTSEACFRIGVQFYTDDTNTPLDDSTVQWNSPFTDIATLTIPAQDVWNSDAKDEYCRHLGFNPMNSLKAHTSVGPISDIRAAVYTSQQALRHQLWGQTNLEPTLADWQNYANL